MFTLKDFHDNEVVTMLEKWHFPAQNFVYDHPKRVTIRTFCSMAVFEAELLWAEELWTHPSVRATSHERARGYNACAVRYDPNEAEVCKAGLSRSVDENIGLNRQSRLEDSEWLCTSKAYPLEIPMDHTLAVHIDQASRDVSQLWKSHNRQQQARTVEARTGTYKFKPVRILTCRHKLVDVPVCHPLRHHRELGLGHYDP